MSNITIPQLPNSNDLDVNDFVILYNTEASPDVFTYKARVSSVLGLQSIAVNGKTGNTITLITDDLSDSTSSNKFVTSIEKSKLSLIRTDLGSNVVLCGDGVYRSSVGSSGNYNYTVNTIADRDNLSNLSLGDRCLVIDATGDPSIMVGAALYFWNTYIGQWVKIAEYDALDFVFNDPYTGATPTTVSIGGIPVGYQLTGKTANQILEKLLVVYQIPAFNSFSISGQASPIEVGIALSGSKTFTWTTSNSGNVQTNSLKIKDVTASAYIATGLTNSGSASKSIGTITNTSPISQSWRIEGVNTQSNSFISSNYTVTSVYPYFYGKVSSGGVAAGMNRPTATAALVTGGTKVVAANNGSLSINFNSTSDDYIWFAHPASNATKTTWFVTALNNGAISGGVSLGGNLFPLPDTVTVTTALWSGVSYKVYISNYQTTSTASMLLS